MDPSSSERACKRVAVRRRRVRASTVVVGWLSLVAGCAQIAGLGDRRGPDEVDGAGAAASGGLPGGGGGGASADAGAGGGAVSPGDGGAGAQPNGEAGRPEPAADGGQGGNSGAAGTGGKTVSAGGVPSEGGTDSGMSGAPSEGGSAWPMSGGAPSGEGGMGGNTGGASVSAGASGSAGAPGEAGPPSCAKDRPGAGDNCGPRQNLDCCASSLVEAGNFDCDPLPSAALVPLEAFRLDKFEVTVGRFRMFAEAVVQEGWRPQPGSGKHPAGANFSAADVGWESDWNARLPSASMAAWNTYFGGCDQSTWTQVSTAREWLPISCVDYYVALAFCIFDGGYLPNAREQSYAAIGGEIDWLYPWGNEPIGPAFAVNGDDAETPEVVGSVPDGDGRWGHSDLAGNVYEWSSYNGEGECSTCNCNRFVSTYQNGRLFGGSYGAQPTELEGRYSKRWPLALGIHHRDSGIRCARAP